ncbi:cysteine--tRNA ligase [Halarchaeum grantii]|uniref:Cysteine--tRNA ligase n=1 Tax=Halarchaeum grantii TaxID=1193105 RepID=A0A830EY89_9EURY|nr:cysteine--tRNA ligase [Halarchaeum grantii]GGL21801.1 cysteine--tRNA ligase [Halarchaeum grantii]
MTLRVSNTLSGETEEFVPQDPDDVRLYYCGLTTSDPPHLGHARSWVHVDVMSRWLRHLGYGVRHVENFTDVNEKIVARVGRDGDDENDVAEQYITEVLESMRALNLERTEVRPRVSEHVPEIVDLVETLVESGHAYESNGSVYFDVTSFEEYGKLSNQDLESIEEQGDPDERSEKRHPADFALWKADGVDADAIARHRGHDHPGTPAHPEGQTWESPWGEGRPGWHIECSAMSMAHLGETLDIHVGGRDLVFPHHENEIAQSEAATGEPFANYWLHCALFEMDEEKMSSSLGNFITVADAVAEYGANALRLFMVSGTYNSRQTYSEDAIDEAVERAERLERCYEDAVTALDSVDAHTKAEDADLRAATEDAATEFEAAMNDDFNTREALTALFDLVSAVNVHLAERDDYDYGGLKAAVETFEEYGGGVLGFELGAEQGGDVTLAEDLVDLVLELREEARAEGEYERADRLRDELEALDVTVEDTDSGPTYRL